jgi:hypothetical protein
MWGLPAETWEFSSALFEQLACQQKRLPNPLIIKWFHCAELGMIDPRYGIFSLPARDLGGATCDAADDRLLSHPVGFFAIFANALRSLPSKALNRQVCQGSPKAQRNAKPHLVGDHVAAPAPVFDALKISLLD